MTPHLSLLLGLPRTGFRARMRVKRRMNRTPFRTLTNFSSDQCAKENNTHPACRNLLSSLNLQPRYFLSVQNWTSVKDLNHNSKGHTRTPILSAAPTGDKDVNKASPLQYRKFSPWPRYFVPYPIFTVVIIPTIYPSLKYGIITHHCNSWASSAW